MTLEEKVNQTLNDYFDGAFGPVVPSDPAGQAAIASEGMRYLFKFCATESPRHVKEPSMLVAECIQTRNHFQTIAKEQSRLGIPISFAEETLHGSLYSPQYPMPINLGCTWNDSLVEQVFSETAWQASAVGINVGLSPVVNMFPDARCGRMQEGFSEDPYLTSRWGLQVS
jgi:beta-glucosidase